MTLTIQSLHVEPGVRLRKEVETRFKQLQHFYDRIEACKVILKKEKSSNQKDHVVEVKMVVTGKILFAKEAAEEFHTAVANVFDAIREQLIGFKEQLQEVR